MMLPIGRRRFLAGLAATPVAPQMANAQPRMRRVAVVAFGDLARPPLASLVDGLRELVMSAMCTDAVEMVIDLKTAKVLGIGIPQSVLFRADEVIE